MIRFFKKIFIMVFGVPSVDNPKERALFRVRVVHVFNGYYGIEYNLGFGWHKLKRFNDCGPSVDWGCFIDYLDRVDVAEKYAKTIDSEDWIKKHNSDLKEREKGYIERRIEFLKKQRPFEIKNIK